MSSQPFTIFSLPTRSFLSKLCGTNLKKASLSCSFGNEENSCGGFNLCGKVGYVHFENGKVSRKRRKPLPKKASTIYLAWAMFGCIQGLTMAKAPGNVAPFERYTLCLAFAVGLNVGYFFAPFDDSAAFSIW